MYISQKLNAGPTEGVRKLEADWMDSDFYFQCFRLIAWGLWHPENTASSEKILLFDSLIFFLVHAYLQENRRLFFPSATIFSPAKPDKQYSVILLYNSYMVFLSKNIKVYGTGNWTVSLLV